MCLKVTLSSNKDERIFVGGVICRKVAIYFSCFLFFEFYLHGRPAVDERPYGSANLKNGQCNWRSSKVIHQPTETGAMKTFSFYIEPKILLGDRKGTPLRLMN